MLNAVEVPVEFVFFTGVLTGIILTVWVGACYAVKASNEAKAKSAVETITITNGGYAGGGPSLASVTAPASGPTPRTDASAKVTWAEFPTVG